MSGPPPKSTMPLNQPITNMLPLASAAMACPRAPSMPSPKALDQRNDPSVPSLATKTSGPMPLMSEAPLPKLAAPTKEPVTSTSPAASTAIPVGSTLAPAELVDQTQPP